MTSRKRRDPGREKQRDYERQHFSPGKSDKGFRKQWPRKKATAQRSFRRTQRAALHSLAEADGDQLDRALASRREQVSKWEVISLRERIRRKQQRKLAEVGARKRRRLKL